MENRLISMVDFVLEQHEQCVSSTNSTYNYAKFLKQKLELWMFVPCDENGNVLEHPNYIKGKRTADFYNEKMNEYQKAEKKCLFEGFKQCVNNQIMSDDIVINIINSNLNFELVFENKLPKSLGRLSTVEQLIQCDLKLTETFLKQIGL